MSGIGMILSFIFKNLTSVVIVQVFICCEYSNKHLSMGFMQAINLKFNTKNEK